MSIVTEIERLQNAKSSIKTAIENKGVEVGNGTLDTYAEKIDAIQTGGGSDIEISDCSYLFYQGARQEQMNSLLKLCKNVTDTSYMCYNNTLVNSINLDNFDTSNLINMRNMFYGCSNLENCSININTDKVTAMIYLFYGCSKLTELDLSSFNTKNAIINNMFNGCSKLKHINLTSFNTSNVTDFSYLFGGCSSLESLDLNNFDAGKVTIINTMFNNCTSLTNLQFVTNFGKALRYSSANNSGCSVTLSKSNNLTHDSLMDVINKLYDLNLTYNVADGGSLRTQKLVIGSTNLAKLTADEIAIATNKGWVVS